MFRPIWLLMAAVICLSLEGCSNEAPRTTVAVARATEAVSKQAAPISKAPSRHVPEQALERPSITILADADESADDRLVADLATALASSQVRLRVGKSQGPEQDLLSLLNNPGIDVALVPTDAIESLPRQVRESVRGHFRYLFRVPSQRLHILARRDIATIHDLDGRKIDIGRSGSGSYLTAHLILDKLGIKPEFTNSNQITAFQRLRSNQIQAMVLLATDSSKDVLAFESDGDFHLVPIPFDTLASRLGELVVHYGPSQLTAEEYPNLVEQGNKVDTVTVNRVLALRNWPEGSAHYQHIAALGEAVSTYFYAEGQNPVGNGIDLTQQAPGWQRFRPTEILLARRTQQADERLVFEEFTDAQKVCPVPDLAARERLYNDFLTWRKAREQDPNSAGSASDKR